GLGNPPPCLAYTSHTYCPPSATSTPGPSGGSGHVSGNDACNAFMVGYFCERNAQARRQAAARQLARLGKMNLPRGGQFGSSEGLVRVGRWMSKREYL